jgi:MobA/MobL family
VYTQSRNLPDWAQGSALAYFAAAEVQEWAGGNAFEEWKITLPHELSHAQNMDLMRDLVDVIAGDRLPITYAFHAPKTLAGKGEQPHLHLLLSGRGQDGIARPQAQHFKKYNRQHPERGGAPKDAALYHGRAVKAWRVTITDAINVHLERAGESVRLHPDTLEDRELTREPEPKLRPSESQAYRETGTISETMEEVLRIRASRKTTHIHETLNARTYWEQRKAELDITRDMDVSEQLAHIAAARAQCRDRAERRPQVQSYVGVEVDDRTLGDQTGEAWSPAIMLALAGEAYRQARVEAEQSWGDVEDAAMSRILAQQGRDWLGEVQRDGQAMWLDARDAQALQDLGWKAILDAREDGQAALVAALQRRPQRGESATATLTRLQQVLESLSDDTGEYGARVKIRLWEPGHDQGQGFG